MHGAAAAAAVAGQSNPLRVSPRGPQAAWLLLCAAVAGTSRPCVHCLIPSTGPCRVSHVCCSSISLEDMQAVSFEDSAMGALREMHHTCMDNQAATEPLGSRGARGRWGALLSPAARTGT
jgi:hypothetical protein